MNRDTSSELFARAKRTIPGGVNSPVRAFKSVGGDPVFIRSAQGATLTDVNGNTYIDYLNSWGPMILGHADPRVVHAVQEAANRSFSFGTPTSGEVDMAEQICKMVPNMDAVRMVSSGTEACMSALRLARGYTKRNKFIKFVGCYHGHADPYLVKAGSGLATLDIQHAAGIPQGAVDSTLLAPYNDLASVANLFKEHAGEIAAIIIEPVAGNMGCIPPAPHFLSGLRELCNEHKSVLIFDEVMTGFRSAQGGVQERMQVDADLITLGKVIGGGLPVGAFGGKQEIMDHLAPIGAVYQAGTLSGNPIAVAAGHTTLKILEQEADTIYPQLESNTQKLAQGIRAAFKHNDIPCTVNQVGSMMSLHFSNEKITDFATASAADNDRFCKYFHHMLDKGVHLPPSPFESWFISYALKETDIQHTIDATADFAKKLID